VTFFDAMLAAARASYEAGELEAASDASGQALAARNGAESAGQTRVAIGAGGLVVLGGGAVVTLRIRRRRQPPSAPAAPGPPAADPSPYPTEPPQPAA